MVCKWRFLVAHDSDCQGLAVACLGFGLPNRIATSDSNSIGWIGLARWFSVRKPVYSTLFLNCWVRNVSKAVRIQCEPTLFLFINVGVLKAADDQAFGKPWCDKSSFGVYFVGCVLV